ncbi:TolC family protein [soil metagenome]
MMYRPPALHSPIAALAAIVLVFFPGSGVSAAEGDERSSAGRPTRDRRVVAGPLALQECILTAVERNLDLASSRSSAAETRYGIATQLAEFDPAMTTSASGGDRRSPQASSELDGSDQPVRESGVLQGGIEKKFGTGTVLGLDGTAFDRDRTNSSFARINPEFNSALTLSLTQPLLKGAGRDANLAALRRAALAYDRAGLDTRTELLQVLLDTEQSYWTLAAAVAIESIRRAALELADFLIEEAEARREANLATPVDVLEARASASEKREDLLVAASSTRDAADELFRVLGILSEAEPGALDLQPLPLAIPTPPDPFDSFEKAIVHAPESLIFENAIRREEVSLAEARQNRKPQLDVTVESGALGRGISQGRSYSKLAERDGRFWDARIEMRVPWGFRLERAQLAQARESLHRALIDRNNAELQIYARIRGAVRDITLAGERIAAAQISVELNEARFEQTKEERAAGESTFRDLLEAQDAMEAARIRVIQARVDLLEAVVTLAQLEGTLPERYGFSLSGDPALGAPPPLPALPSAPPAAPPPDR